ncbi:hypothetical protein SAMN03159353_10525 [Cedecea sp. NFIX57]|jgi:hypothetical protein|nr:hypothetical protein SAMN03159353_10525 [Cedecea sp. NFIX57]
MHVQNDCHSNGVINITRDYLASCCSELIRYEERRVYDCNRLMIYSVLL